MHMNSVVVLVSIFMTIWRIRIKLCSTWNAIYKPYNNNPLPYKQNQLDSLPINEAKTIPNEIICNQQAFQLL